MKRREVRTEWSEDGTERVRKGQRGARAG